MRLCWVQMSLAVVLNVLRDTLGAYNRPSHENWLGEHNKFEFSENNETGITTRTSPSGVLRPERYCPSPPSASDGRARAREPRRDATHYAIRAAAATVL